MLKFVDELPLDGDANGFSGWGRLDLHARRVRTLYMEPLHIRIPPNIYFRIHAMRDSPLLPGLKKIYIPNNPPQVHPGFSYIPSPNLNNPSVDLSSALFLASGSTLDTVQIDSNAISDREFFVPFLSLLYIKSPGLSHLALRGVALSASVEHIYRFTELQSLEIRLPFPPLHQLLHKLGELPHLLDLIIDTDDFAPSIQPHTTPISISNSKFTQLRHLQILGTTGSIRCILNVLKGLTNLSALKIDRESDTVTPWGFQVQVQDISEIWKPFFEVISTFSAIEDIEIFDRSRESISASSLAPLFRLDNLKSFVINDIILSGSDDDFHLLAGGFPKLKKFVIPRPLLSDRRTLVCLYFLSRDCPDLRGVTITLLSNISENLNAIKELPHPIVRNHHPLEKLYIDSDFGQLQPIQLVGRRLYVFVI